MRMKSLAPVLAVSVAVAATGLLAVAQQDPGQQTQDRRTLRPQDGQRESSGRLEPQSAAEVKQLVDTSTKQLTELIRTAEQHTGGRAFAAAMMEWHCIDETAAKSTTDQGMRIQPTGLRDSTDQPSSGREPPGQSGTTGQPGDRPGQPGERPGQPGESGARTGQPGVRPGMGGMQGANQKASPEEMRTLSPTDPVALIMCVSDNWIREVIINCKSGNVLAMKQHQKFMHGKSGFTRAAFGGEGVGSVHMAGGQQGTSGQHARGGQQGSGRWQKVSDLLDKPIIGQRNQEEIGTIKDMVIDPDAGHIYLTVAEFSGELGEDNRLYAIPFKKTQLSQDYRSIVLQAQESEIRSANGFNQDSWPDLSDEQLVARIYESFNAEPYWRDRTMGGVASGATGQGTVRPVADRPGGVGQQGSRLQPPNRWQKVSDLIGKDVQNPQTNENLGNLNEIVVDPDSGRVLYGILSFGGFLGLGDKLFAVPWSELRLSSDYKTLALNVDKEKLKDAEGFDKDNWPDMSDTQFSERIHRFYRGALNNRAGASLRD